MNDASNPTTLAPRGRSLAGRYLLLGAALVLVVGAIAWVTQWMPNWRSTNVTPPPPPKNDKAAGMRFLFTQAMWDKDPEYLREYEKDVHGHYDFPFGNFSDQPQELGLLRSNCDCASVDVTLQPEEEVRRYVEALAKDPIGAKAPDWTWQTLARDEYKGIVVPPQSKGLVRINWKGRKEAGQRLNLSSKMWYQPKGVMRAREFADLEVPIVMAHPAQFYPARANVGVLGPADTATAEFFVWSATRDALDMSIPAKAADPLISVDTRPLKGKEIEDLQADLKKSVQINTRIRVAYLVKVTVREQIAGKQLPQGPLYVAVPLQPDGEPFSSGSPLIIGMVRGEVQVGAVDDHGKIDLKTFYSREVHRRTISLRAPEASKFTVDSVEPGIVEAKLTKKETTAAKTRWELEVIVPANSVTGALPDDSAVILRTQTTPPRYIRIPLTGNAVQG